MALSPLLCKAEVAHLQLIFRGLLCISWASTVAFKVNPPDQQPCENVFHLRISLF